MKTPIEQKKVENTSEEESNLVDVDGELAYPTNDKCITNAEKPEDEETKGELRQTWELFMSCRMMKFVPLMIWSATSLAVFSAIFIPLFTDSMTGKSSKIQTKDALISMVFLGIGSIVGSMLWGYL